jgi:hypothetical protein
MWPEGTGATGQSPEWNPLTADDVLVEAELLDVRLDPGRSTVGLILDINGVLGPRDGNVGVLVARRVQALSWDVAGADLARAGDRYARYILGATWTSSPSEPLRLDLFPQIDTQVRITARQFDFYGVQVDGIPDAPPDFTELDDAAIHSQRPGWNSPFRLLSYCTRAAVPPPELPAGPVRPRRSRWPRRSEAQ